MLNIKMIMTATANKTLAVSSLDLLNLSVSSTIKKATKIGAIGPNTMINLTAPLAVNTVSKNNVIKNKRL